MGKKTVYKVRCEVCGRVLKGNTITFLEDTLPSNLMLVENKTHIVMGSGMICGTDECAKLQEQRVFKAKAEQQAGMKSSYFDVPPEIDPEPEGPSKMGEIKEKPE